MPRANDKRQETHRLRQARNKVRRIMERFLKEPNANNRRDRVQNAMGEFLMVWECVNARDSYTPLPCAAHGVDRCRECQ